jgi:hypothetical protein
MKDPIVEEVRKNRMEHTRKFNGDLAAICADLRTIQAASGYEVVRLRPKRLEATGTFGHQKLPRRKR